MTDEQVLASLQAKRELLHEEARSLHEQTMRCAREARAVEAAIALLIRIDDLTKDAA